MRGILFVKEMYTAASIDLDKTETRRTHGLNFINVHPHRWKMLKNGYCDDGRLEVNFRDISSPDKEKIKSKFKKGEILFLCEPMWIQYQDELLLSPLELSHYYCYDIDESNPNTAKALWGHKKISPMFMKQEYGRKFIKIKKISCERVQDISLASIKREGVKMNFKSKKIIKAAYATLFDRVNKPGAWFNNPYVFVYVFEYLPDYNRRSEND